MSIDLEKVSKLTGFVDKLIQIKDMETILDESVVGEMIDQAITISGASYTNEEKEAAKRDITWKYQIFATPGQSILEDYEQDNWYDDRKAEIEPKFWTRYKNYLIDTKHFSPNIVSTLGEDTLDQKLMNYILDPNADYPHPVLRRGLIIGDVQSGKTSTYIGFICKAADAGYKVFILLTGTIESLRKQTQERVEEGFIGIDMSANTTGGKRVGVGLDNKPIHAMAMTSRASDFKGDNDKIAVSLAGNNDAVVFVIKKNTTTLTKLTNWLVTLNADPVTKKIDMPMLMIDDEADNASINTSASKEDPTKINKLIRELASKRRKEDDQRIEDEKIKKKFWENPQTREILELRLNDAEKQVVQEENLQFTRAVNNGKQTKKIFISHKEVHKLYGQFIVDVLETYGVDVVSTIIFTGDRRLGVPQGKDIYDYLKDCFREDLMVIFLFSKAFYDSNICISEAGAAWATNQNCMNVVIDISFSDIEKPSNNALSSIKFQQIRTPDQTITVTEFFKTIIEEGLHLEYDESKLQKALNDVLETDKYSDQKIDFPATFLPKRKFLPVPRCSKCHNIMLLTEENGRLKYVCSNVSCDECYEAVIN
mgnify:CR=1 FL=1